MDGDINEAVLGGGFEDVMRHSSSDNQPLSNKQACPEMSGAVQDFNKGHLNPQGMRVCLNSNFCTMATLVHHRTHFCTLHARVYYAYDL